MADPLIITLGCRLNAYELEVMRKNARPTPGCDEAIIVNTCAVTAEAVRQATQTIRKLRREHPEARIIVTGCAAQIEPERFAALPEVDHVIGNAEKMKRETFTALSTAGSERVQVDDIMSVRETAHHLIDGFGVAHARLRAGAERLRSPLHLLHHPVRPRPVALGAGRRRGRAGPPPRRERLPRGRADRRRHHLLRQAIYPAAPRSARSYARS